MIRRLLRDPLAHFLVAGAAIWGTLALTGDPVDPASRTIELSRERQAGIAFGFERMMGRPPTDAERQQMADFIKKQAASYSADGKAMERAVADFCQLMFCLNEFIFID